MTVNSFHPYNYLLVQDFPMVDKFWPSGHATSPYGGYDEFPDHQNISEWGIKQINYKLSNEIDSDEGGTFYSY
jgi:hypothetical protein